VLAAIGLNMSDLFPQRHGRDFDPTAPQSGPPRFRASELLSLAARECLVVALAAEDFANGKGLSDKDYARIMTALEILSAIVLEVSSNGR